MVTAEQTACMHTGRVRPVVWKVNANGEVPQTVLCEQCGRAIGASEPASDHYVEGADGWYAPAPSAAHP